MKAALSFLLILHSLAFGAQATDYVQPYQNRGVACDRENPLLWDALVCSLQNFDLQPQCQPRFVESTQLLRRGRNAKPKGLVVAFHGFTSCPDAFDELTFAWLQAGYDVMVPLLPGHGRAQGGCETNDSTGILRVGECAGRDVVAPELPLLKQGYIDFVELINDIVREEVAKRSYKQVMVTGLSHGGPMAGFAVTAAPGLYDKMLLMNPSFVITIPALDRKFTSCVTFGMKKLRCRPEKKKLVEQFSPQDGKEEVNPLFSPMLDSDNTFSAV